MGEIRKRMSRLIKPLAMTPILYLHRLRRRRQLSRRLETTNRQVLVNDLMGLKVPSGSIVLVHTSLKALGFVEGGAAAVVDALIDAFVKENNGTVMLPAFSIDGTMYSSLKSGRVFDVKTTTSNLGAIPETFRQCASARRSVHPTHSFAAVGPDAEWLVKDHHLCGSSFGRGSPMARMMERDGYILGMGTNLGTVTFYHCLEEIEETFPVDVFTPDSPIKVQCRDYSGVTHILSVCAHDPDPNKIQYRIDRPESKELRELFRRRFEQYALLKWYQIGQAKSWLVPAKRLYEEYKRLVENGITVYTSGEEARRKEQQSDHWSEPKGRGA